MYRHIQVGLDYIPQTRSQVALRSTLIIATCPWSTDKGAFSLIDFDGNTSSSSYYPQNSTVGASTSGGDNIAPLGCQPPYSWFPSESLLQDDDPVAVSSSLPHRHTNPVFPQNVPNAVPVMEGHNYHQPESPGESGTITRAVLPPMLARAWQDTVGHTDIRRDHPQ
jgi:hypothetical protein